MNNFNLIGLTLYIFYVPTFFFLLNLAKKKYKGYSIFSFWISSLGERGSCSYPIFVASFFSFGIFNLFFIKIFSGLLPDIILTKVTAFFLYLSAFSSILVIFFPMDTRPSAHERIGNLMFVGLLGSFLFVTYPIYISDIIPNFLIILNVLVFFFLILLAGSFTMLRLKYGMDALANMVEIRKKEKSFVLRNTAFFEWIVLFLITIWLFAAALIVYPTFSI